MGLTALSQILWVSLSCSKWPPCCCPQPRWQNHLRHKSELRVIRNHCWSAPQFNQSCPRRCLNTRVTHTHTPVSLGTEPQHCWLLRDTCGLRGHQRGTTRGSPGHLRTLRTFGTLGSGQRGRTTITSIRQGDPCRYYFYYSLLLLLLLLVQPTTF